MTTIPILHGETVVWDEDDAIRERAYFIWERERRPKVEHDHWLAATFEEFDEERDPALLKAAIRNFGITWPIAVDNDHRIWNAYSNQYWPALYLIDRDGHIVYRHYGEGNDDVTEQRIRQLLGKA